MSGKNSSPHDANDGGSGGDRRRAERFDTRLQIAIQSLKDGSKLDAFATDISSTGMRIETASAIPENTLLRIAFVAASNNTHCEGRVVWSRPSRNGSTSDSGIDIVRWGGDLPTEEFIRRAPNTRLKPDRRRPR